MSRPELPPVPPDIAEQVGQLIMRLEQFSRDTGLICYIDLYPEDYEHPTNYVSDINIANSRSGQ